MYERLLNKQIVPTSEELAAYCGGNGARFQKLNEQLSQLYGTTQEIRFPYGNHYGWGVAHRKKKKLICDVFAEAGAFTVMLRLSNQQFDSVYDQMQAYTQNCIDNRYPCGEGGWIHYRVLNEEHFNDIMRLLAVKCG